MWRYMESNEDTTFVRSYEEGVDRVLNDNYAFLCESTMLHYLLQRNCNLTQECSLIFAVLLSRFNFVCEMK
jgi:ionotropic glutamate receptor